MDEKVDHWRSQVAAQVKEKMPLEKAGEELNLQQAAKGIKNRFVSWTVDTFDDDRSHCAIKVRYSLDKQKNIVGGHVETECIYRPKS